MQQFVQGNDPFERVEFDSEELDKVDPTTGQLKTPKLTLRTNTGQALEFKLTGESKQYTALAAWAADAAEKLAAAGR